MELYLLVIAILLPALSAALCYTIRKAPIRNVIVIITTLIMFAVAGGFLTMLLQSDTGKISIELGGAMALSTEIIIKILDLFLFLIFISVGIKQKKPLIIILTLLQLIPLLIFEFTGAPEGPETAFVIDYLSLIMVLLVSIIGPVITVFALGYMKEHEHHLKLKSSRQPRFFFILFIFLGAMNALVMTDNLMWMYFFWEVTTLCSFLLISHDGTAQSIKNGLRALWINMLGGIAFIAGIIFICNKLHTISIQEIVELAPNAGVGTLVPLALGLLCFAGFTKSAQFPFQSWLLGAMVAPTPVSALLHSSTMVKAGVYLVVRLAPAYSGTMLGKVVAVVGGFTFLAGSAIAISQSNAKRVLAYSTIANLGIIICCAGIGSPLAIGVAIMLIIFHAVSKALLFLCVGTIEHGIGSRDIEDMQGLMKIMPFTATITVIGMVSMLLPPFGVLITKWLAIEASVGKSPVVLVCIILGSALTVVFWAKWIGIMLTMSYRKKFNKENLPLSVKSALSILVVAVLGCSVCVAPIYNTLIKPQIAKYFLIGNTGGSIWSTAGIGDFPVIYFFVLFFAILLLVPYFLRKTKPESVKPPYLCGENITDDMKGLQFMSPADTVENTVVHNYYLSGFFGEDNLTLWTNVIAGAIILIMFGVII